MQSCIRTSLCLLIFIFLSCAKQNIEQNTEQNAHEMSAKSSQEMQGTQQQLLDNTKTITDHAGNIIEIPKEPKRIASLHTLSTTHMLWDLEAPLIGTATRILENENRPYIRSVEEVFGVRFQDTGLVDYGKKGQDIERIKESKPDLIVGTQEHEKIYEQLSAIAPTIIIAQGTSNMFDVFRDLATWINKTDVFDAKYKLYLEKLARTKAKFSTPPSEQTIAYALPLKGKAMFEARKHYGALTYVAYALDFKISPFIAEQFPQENDVGGKISAEFVPKLQSDWLLSTYNNQQGETTETVHKNFDEIAPGWRDYVPSYKEQKVIVFPRESSRPMSFKVMDMILGVFGQAAK